ncbi:MAG: hypothetical protein M9939_17255 [Mesorhizobium sp.]|nr:hypothetical protein [Mesorhizobium sp.]MCO5162885.1 hypothetical protein [Mesorhizobium sp.]
MTAHVRIEDVALWLKHIDEPELQARLARLDEDETIHLETDGVVGRWRRMRQGKNSAPTPALLPDGPMKTIWNEWFRVRKGSKIEIREVTLADEFLASGSLLFSEWYSAADEEAFRDL